jgi:hypothetical protein
VAGCVRHPAAAWCVPAFILFNYSLFMSTCSDSMLMASCGTIIVYLFFVYHLVPAAASCRWRPAAAWCRPLLFTQFYLFIIYLFIYLSLIVCSGSMREASRGSMVLAIIIYLLWFIYYLFIHYYLFITSSLSISQYLQRQHAWGILRQHKAGH